MKLRFFGCGRCGCLVHLLRDAGAPLMCCGEEMQEIVPGAADGAAEKHVPVYTVEGNRVSVRVGVAAHPMLAEHSIQWIALQTKQGAQFKALSPGRAPEASFALCDADEAEAAFALCDLHGLWKA